MFDADSLGRATSVQTLRSRPRSVVPWLGVVALCLSQGCAATDESDVDLQSTEQALGEDASLPPIFFPDASLDDARTTPDADIPFEGGSPFEGGFPFEAGLPFPDAAIPTIDASTPPDAGLPFDGGFPFPVEPVPFGHYTFDDCSPTSTRLLDSSPQANHATRSASVTCSAGVLGSAVTFDARADTVTTQQRTLPTLRDRLAVAAWVQPEVNARGTIVSKQTLLNQPFALLVQGGQVQFRVAFNGGLLGLLGTTRTVQAPIPTGVWSHVAGMYDGETLRLLIDGKEVSSLAHRATIADGRGSLAIGNQGGGFVHGRIDDVWLTADPIAPDQLAQRACVRNMPSLTVTPHRSAVVTNGTTVTYDIAVQSRDTKACSSNFMFASNGASPPGFQSTFRPFFAALAPGQTTHFLMDVTSDDNAEGGVHTIPFTMFSFGGPSPTGSVEYVLAERTGCFVRPSRELVITDVSVVDDPVRTTFDAPASDARRGAFTFGHMMEQLAPTPAQAPAMVQRMFNTWLSEQSINGFSIPARPRMQTDVLAHWPRTADGQLDLTRAPLRLLAIVNRIDSRDTARGHAGEGRFVYGVLGENGLPLEFTFILEYRLPATNAAQVLEWANAWHALGALPFPSEAYNAALQALTDRFTRHGAEPGRVNGSALSQLRTNEIALERRWELREFELADSTDMLEPSTVKLTPDQSFFNDSPLLAQFVNDNEQSILIERHEVPTEFAGTRFLGGNSFNDLLAWRATGIRNNEARHKFSLNTCNGCHSLDETGTFFLHISPRSPGFAATLSPFMTGVTLSDPVTGEPRTLNDVRRRLVDMEALVCPSPARTLSTASKTAPGVSIERGIGRVH